MKIKQLISAPMTDNNILEAYFIRYTRNSDHETAGGAAKNKEYSLKMIRQTIYCFALIDDDGETFIVPCIEGGPDTGADRNGTLQPLTPDVINELSRDDGTGFTLYQGIDSDPGAAIEIYCDALNECVYADKDDEAYLRIETFYSGATD